MKNRFELPIPSNKHTGSDNGKPRLVFRIRAAQSSQTSLVDIALGEEGTADSFLCNFVLEVAGSYTLSPGITQDLSTPGPRLIPWAQGTSRCPGVLKSWVMPGPRIEIPPPSKTNVHGT